MRCYDPIDVVRQVAPLNTRVKVHIRQGAEPEVQVMPYERDEDLPDAVKGGLSKARRDKWRAIFNSVLDKDKDEEKAFRIAWAQACEGATADEHG